MASLQNSFCFPNSLFIPKATSSQHSLSHNPIPLFFFFFKLALLLNWKRNVAAWSPSWLPGNLPSWGCREKRCLQSSHEVQECLSRLSGRSSLLDFNLQSCLAPCKCFRFCLYQMFPEHVLFLKVKQNHKTRTGGCFTQPHGRERKNTRSWKTAFNAVWGGGGG